MDVQRANRDAANAALKIAREEMAQMTLTAPFSGTVASVHVRNHQVIAAGQPIATLTRADVLDVVFNIPEKPLYRAGYSQCEIPAGGHHQRPAGARVCRRL